MTTPNETWKQEGNLDSAYADTTETGAETDGNSPVGRWAWVVGGALAVVGAAGIARAVAGKPIIPGMGQDDIDHSPSASVGHKQGIRVEKSVTVNRTPEDCYRFWHNFENLPRFMKHLESVHVLDAKRSHWKAKAPAGKSVEWDAVIINDIPNELIAWQSVPESDVANAGSVRFEPAPGDRGTVVTVNMEYDPPAGKVGALVAKLFDQEPTQQVQDALRHFKEVMEAGEIPTIDGQPKGE